MEIGTIVRVLQHDDQDSPYMDTINYIGKYGAITNANNDNGGVAKVAFEDDYSWFLRKHLEVVNTTATQAPKGGRLTERVEKLEATIVTLLKDPEISMAEKVNKLRADLDELTGRV